MPDDKPFVHLHVHTEYSLLDGLGNIKKLVNRAAEMGMPALAITDHGTMYGVIDFYRACQNAGIKPVIGMEAYLTPWGRHMTDRESEIDSRPYHLLLLARNQVGYKNLLKIASAAQLEGYYYRPRVDHDFLAQHADGLIATSGCLAAEIPRLLENGQEEFARQQIGWYQDTFGRENFFLELQQHQIEELQVLNRWLVENQGYANVPLLATNDVHYIRSEDFDAHDTLLCIQTSSVKAEQNRMRFSGPTFHLRSQEEMWRLFADVPEALTNSLLIADMCEVDLESKGYHLPVFPVPDGYTAETYLRYLCDRGLRWRYGSYADDPEVRERLDYELSVIHNMGFDTYFLIVWDLCEYARHADIWWNVRGSGAGSVAAYSLGITNIEPLRNDLLFERFLNPGRITMPDIDLDFPEDRRAEMIQYCTHKYGEDKVAAIITFGTLGSKAAIRDVGRALDIPLPTVDRIARLIPTAAKAIKFDDALSEDPEKALPDLKALYNTDETAHKLIEAAHELEGVTRHASTHAAGIIVADKPLIEYIPLHRPTKGSAEDAPVKMVTQFPMETCESIGLLKIDFLGLSTLTIMRKACELIEENYGIHYDLSTIPYRPDPDDPEVTRMVSDMFEMIGRGETVGVFQLESQGMRRMLTDMRPTRFEHIVAAVALYRPGPMEYIPAYNRRLRGEEKVEYIHPKLQSIIDDTYGIIIYQEQIMRIGAELFGYSLGEADLMRRAVSKKKKEDLLKHRQTFVERGPDYGVDVDSANKIFDDIEFFARYGFNKSHAADYAAMTCQTAFLKCHYPHEYMTALMSVHRDDSAKVSLFAADCQRLGIPVLPPNVNASMVDFHIEPQPDGTRAIRFGLAAIKNLGLGPTEHILEQRGKGGRFLDLDDFCRRVDARTVSKRAMESLIKVGAMDDFAPRPVLLAALDQIISFSADYHKAQDVGQMSLFGDVTGVSFGAEESILHALHDVEPISRREMLNWERDLVGLYVTDHPLKGVMEKLQHVITHTSADLVEAGEAVNGQQVTVAGLVADLRSIITKKGDAMAVVTLEDITGTIGAVLFPRTWEKYRSLVDLDAVVVLRGKADTSRGDVQVIVDSVTQDFEVVKAVDARPAIQEARFTWLEDEHAPEDTISGAGPETFAPGTVLEGEPEEVRGEDQEPVDETPASPVSAPGRHRESGMITNREMPGWLEDDLDNGRSQPTGYVYHNNTGHIIGVEEPEEEPESPAFDAAGRLVPPPAPAARPREEEPLASREPPRLRRGHPAPEPEPEPEPGRTLTLHVPRSGDSEKDRRRLKKLHGRLIQYPGRDQFRFILEGAGAKPVCLSFPKQPIRIDDEVLDFVRDYLGDENVEIE